MFKQTKRAKSRRQFLDLKTACSKISKRGKKKRGQKKKGQGRRILGEKNNNEIHSIEVEKITMG